MGCPYLELRIWREPKLGQVSGVLIRSLDDDGLIRRRLERQALRRRGHARDALELASELANRPRGSDAALRRGVVRHHEQWHVCHGAVEEVERGGEGVGRFGP